MMCVVDEEIEEEEPVAYCRRCKSLAIINYDFGSQEDNTSGSVMNCYCRDCGCTDIGLASIEDWIKFNKK